MLAPHAAAVAEKLAPGGTLVLSGILATQQGQIADAYAALGLRVHAVTAQDEWVAMEFRGA